MYCATAPTTIVRFLRSLCRPARLGLLLLALVILPCLILAPWSLRSERYNGQRLEQAAQLQPPSSVAHPLSDDPSHTQFEPMGTDGLGRSVFWRCMQGGLISLGLGFAAAAVAVIIGTGWGALAGFVGGRVDALMMRIVDILYGLPYLLLVVLISVAAQGLRRKIALSADDTWLQAFAEQGGVINLLTLIIAIGGVSWLTMARVIRGQVLSLRNQPFVEAARALGAGPMRIFLRHLIPNLMGPIIVYATLAIPQAILQESFLSFLGIGVDSPLSSWGTLCADGVKELSALGQPDLPVHWWLPLFPCLLLGMTLLGLNFAGDALRDRWDPYSS